MDSKIYEHVKFLLCSNYLNLFKVVNHKNNRNKALKIYSILIVLGVIRLSRIFKPLSHKNCLGYLMKKIFVSIFRY